MFSPVLLLLLLTLCSLDLFARDAMGPERSSFRLNEIGIGGGYASGRLIVSKDDFDVYPLYVRIGFDMSGAVGLSGSTSTLQLSFDPFVNAINAHESGIETGVTVFLRYFYPVSHDLSLFGEIGSGPMYLSIETDEQRNPGFNFLNQFGLGMQYKISEKLALNAAYRYRHLSHGGLRDNRNLGMDSFGVVGGISFLY